MENKFDTVPDGEPERLQLQSYWTWKNSDLSNAYPTADYTVSYIFTNLEADTHHTIEASKIDGEHVVQVSTTDTASFSEGEHSVAVRVVRDADDEQVTLEGGTIFIDSPEPEQTYNMKVLVAIRATLAGTATKEQQQYSIAGRQLIRRGTGELLRMEQEFTRRVEAERRQRDRLAGKSSRNTVLARFKA